MKPSRMKEHIMKKHINNPNKNILYFYGIRNKFDKQKAISGLFNKIHLNHSKDHIVS